jgi:hypothetical protein
VKRSEIAVQFIERFCAADIEGVEQLLAVDLRFSGPLFHSGNRHDYIESLRADPPERCRYHLISVTENATQAVVIYDYIKADSNITIAQLFQFDAQLKISEILLLFDTGCR